MTKGKGTYGRKRGRPPKKKKGVLAKVKSVWTKLRKK